MKNSRKIAKAIFSARDSGDIPYDAITRIAEDLSEAGLTMVVRCKNCCHCKKVQNALYCTKLSGDKESHWVDKDFYCAYGERREDETTNLSAKESIPS